MPPASFSRARLTRPIAKGENGDTKYHTDQRAAVETSSQSRSMGGYQHEMKEACNKADFTFVDNDANFVF